VGLRSPKLEHGGRTFQISHHARTGSADRVVTGPWARALIVAPTPLRALGPHPERPFRQGFGVAVDADTRQGNKPAHG
jgi:hypothetical protein